MKIFYASLIQETNTFCPQKTDLALFERGYVLRGEEIPRHLAGTNTEIGGFLSYFSEHPADLVPAVACWGVACGKVEDAAFAQLSGEILDALEAQLPVDGVLLALHGAMVSESCDDCEGVLLERVRDLVGADVPVVTTLDYHANLTEKMVVQADAMVGFRTYPHVDFAQTGRRAALILDRLLHGMKRPVPIFRKLPLIVPVEAAETGQGVSGEVIAALGRMDRDPDLVSASLFCAQPWLDIEEMGVSLLFYLQPEAPDQKKWKETADALALSIFQQREAFFQTYPSLAEAVGRLPAFRRPVIFVDSGDITTAGGLGDSTETLRALLGCSQQAALSIVSPKAVAQAFSVGLWGEGEITVGGDQDYGYNRDVTVHAKVLALSQDRSQVTGEAFSGVAVNTGRRAHLLVDGHIHVVAAEYASLMYDPQFLRDLGVEPAEMDVIVQKSHKLFRSAYASIAKEIVILDTPGFTDLNIQRLPYARVPRPIYPLDEIVPFE